MRSRGARSLVVLTVAALGAATAGSAQSPAQQERYERYLEIGSLVTGGRVTPNWLADGTGFWFAEGGPENTVLIQVDRAGQRRPLLDVARVREAFRTALGRELPYRGLPFETFVPRADGRLQVTFEGRSYALDTVANRVARLPRNSYVDDVYQLSDEARFTPRPFQMPRYLVPDATTMEVLSPDRRQFVSIQNGNLVLRSTADGRYDPLTRDGTPDFGWTTEAPRVALKAGGVIGMVALDPWSPDGTMLYAARLDRRQVEVNPRQHFLKRNDEVVPIRVVRAGGALDEYQPHVVSVLSKETVPLDVGPTRDRFFNLIGWRPDGSEVILARYERDFRRMDLLACRPVPKACRVVVSDTASTFVAVQHEVIYYGNTGVSLLPDGSGILMFSTRSGWRQLYHYDFDGRLVAQLTRGEYPALSVEAVDPKARVVYYSAHSDPKRPYDVHIMRVPLNGGPATQLTEEPGQHEAIFSPSMATFVDIHSAVDRPVVSDLRSNDGRRLGRLGTMDVSALKAVGWTPPEEFTVKAADGVTDLWGVMYKPADFDPAKKYPVLEWIYGGPQIVWCARNFSAPEMKQQAAAQALAQLGYVVVCLDARGTPERSKAFQDVVFKAWGVNEIKDHAGAIRQLGARHRFMDLDRVGIYGHSWGGYFTVAALAQAPDLYKAGVASSPGFDPYDAVIYEPYLGGIPGPGNKAAYDRATAFNWAPSLKGKLMLVAGTNDNSVLTSTMKMAHALIEAGVDHEFVVLPEQYHGYGTRFENYFLRKKADFFARWLLADEGSARVKASR